MSAPRERLTKEQLLGTCLRFELEAAALYRRFHLLTRDPELEELWTSMAEEELRHAHFVDGLSARSDLVLPEISRAALAGVVERVSALRRAAEPEAALDDDKMVAIAAALEFSEMDDLFAAVCRAAGVDIDRGRADHLSALVQVVIARQGEGAVLRHLVAAMVRLHRRANDMGLVGG